MSDSTTTSREGLLARTFVDLADSLVDRFDTVDLMVLLTERVVELTGGGAAGLVLLDANGTLRLIAATSDALETVELFQIQNDEGPCRDCTAAGAPVSADDLESAMDRWPKFVPVALASGYRSVHTFPLQLRGTTIGALGLFGTTATGLRAADLEVTRALAHVATIAVLQSQALVDAQGLSRQLQDALTSRVIIEQAKGVIAEQAQVDMDEAFRRLRSHARHHHELLTEVAQLVIDGALSADRLAT